MCCRLDVMHNNQIILGKPQTYDTNITLGVTGTTGIEFEITVIAYPEPDYKLNYGNGTRNIHIGNKFIRNSVNNFTVFYNQTIVNQEDYGTYYLTISNAYGETNVSVNILPQRKHFNLTKTFNITLVTQVT